MMSKEILMVVDAVSNEKGVSREVIFEAIESALAMATKKLNEEEEIHCRVAVNRKTGEYETFRIWTVVADDESPSPGPWFFVSPCVALMYFYVMCLCVVNA